MTALRKVDARRTATACASIVAAVCAAYALVPAAASARPVAHPRSSRIAAFPRARGVIPSLSSPTALAKRAEAIRDALSAARAAHAKARAGKAVRNEEGLLPGCTRAEESERALATNAVCYRGGPVLHDPTVHLIFWQGPLEGPPGELHPANPKVSLFPAKYEKVVQGYVEDLVHESGQQSNVFAIDPQYFEETEHQAVPGEYALAFANGDSVADNNPFPAHVASECSDLTTFSEGPCLLDSDIQSQVATVAAEKGWTTESLNDVYLVMTPPGVGGCFDGTSECAYSVYCAYHGDFGGNGMTPGQQTLYADLPYVGGVEGCDSGVHPNEVQEGPTAAGADAIIDDASHELNEAVTDPIGSQCDEESEKIVGCEPLSWTDPSGQEVADKCLPPETPFEAIYGNALGALLGSGTPEEIAESRYNQVINGHFYWTQREWSNEAGGFFERFVGAPMEEEGACVQRMLGVPTANVSAHPAASVPTTFDVSSSAGAGATYWIWNFGDGEQVGSENAIVAHTYALPGEYEVAVTAFDPYGSSRGHVVRVRVAAAPPASPPPTQPTTVTVTTVTATVPAPVAHYTAATLATKLGLPRAGVKLAGLGVITFGHGTCPPACSVSGRLTTRVSSVSHHRHVTRTVLIGTVTLTIAPGGTGTIALKLNSAGRSLLRSKHRLAASLALSVTGREGGSWQLTRSFTLTASGSSSARARRAARLRHRG
jgi:PKD repeat protein